MPARPLAGTSSAQGGGAASEIPKPKLPSLSKRIQDIDVVVPENFKDNPPGETETAQNIVSNWIIPSIEATENVNKKYTKDTKRIAHDLSEKIYIAKKNKEKLFKEIEYKVHGELKTQTLSNGGKRKRRKQTKKNKHKRK
jgi:hypothetical protein